MLRLTSPTITDRQPLPVQVVGPGQGENLSPALEWNSDAPAPAAWALQLTDDDAPDYRHWMVLLPGHVSALEAGLLPDGAVQGQGTRALGYEGPCPPSGTHHYVFTLTALSAMPGLAEGFEGIDFDRALAELAVESAMLRGTHRPRIEHTVRVGLGRVLNGARKRLPAGAVARLAGRG